MGSRSTYLAAQSHVPIPHSARKTAIKKWTTSTHEQWWNAYPGGVHTKKFFPQPSQRWSKDLLSLKRKQIRRVVGAITDHCGLNKHLSKMGLSPDPRCTCGLEDETGFHVICECPRFSSLRRKILGDYTLRPLDIPILGPTVINRFLVGTNRFT